MIIDKVKRAELTVTDEERDSLNTVIDVLDEIRDIMEEFETYDFTADGSMYDDSDIRIALDILKCIKDDCVLVEVSE